MEPLAQIRAIAERVAGSRGLEIWDIQSRREAVGHVVRVFIDRPGPAATSAALRAQAAGEYDGLRAYRRGDPLKLVVWKKAARAQATGSEDLVSRDTQQTQREELWLDAQAANVADTEARLSRLCAWVLMADRLGVDYGVRVAGRVVQPSQGEAHRRACLEALALC